MTSSLSPTYNSHSPPFFSRPRDGTLISPLSNSLKPCLLHVFFSEQGGKSGGGEWDGRVTKGCRNTSDAGVWGHLHGRFVDLSSGMILHPFIYGMCVRPVPQAVAVSREGCSLTFCSLPLGIHPLPFPFSAVEFREKVTQQRSVLQRPY